MHINNKIFIFALVVILFFNRCDLPPSRPAIIKQMQNDLYYLADDQLEGRETGTRGELWASKYLVNRFMQIGLQPKGDSGYIQTFDFRKKRSGEDSATQEPELTGRNVIGYIDNHAENTVVIGAHYDHLGYGGENSLYRGGPAVHNGADDNASGTAALLTLAQRLKRRDKNNNYLFIAFSGEEEGLFGSGNFVRSPTIDLKKVDYMINMDMVGRLRDSALVIYGTGTSPAWNDVLDHIRMDQLKIKKEESGIGPSDQTSFYLQDIPVLHFFTGQHEDYHKPSDDADKINYEGMYDVVAFIDSVVTGLNDAGKLTFTKTRDQDSGKAPKFSVTLGVVPDYIFDGKGMRIDGVSEDRPAQKAGMQKGDIVIRMGDVMVTDMMSYMEGLSKFRKGDTTTVIALRDGREKAFKVKF